jgi:hypothetical protein
MKVYSFCDKIFLCIVYGVTWVSCRGCYSKGAPKMSMKVQILHWRVESAKYQKDTKKKQNTDMFKKK